jgi:glutaminase
MSEASQIEAGLSAALKRLRLGVGGGIVAVMPGEYAVAVWSPELDSSGNSMVGGAALELLTTLTGQSVF